MNIFKVLASGKKSFQEETASAIIAWFLNPSMEHGLGYSFLSTFLEEISISTNNQEKLKELTEKLTPRLRNEYETQLKLWCNLEDNVDTAFIDIVFGIENWILAIENKIYTQSVSEGQLKKEYEGLKRKYPESKVGMIYLVPIEEDSDMLDGKTEAVFNELVVNNNDFKAVVTWQRNSIDTSPSIAEIISKILEAESKGVIDPIAEYTRHTLKALNAFISNSFAGYEYERETQSSGVNPLTEKQIPIHQLSLKSEGYVGVKGGLRGLLKMDHNKLRSHNFQYSSQNMSHKPYWIDIVTFNNAIRWLLDGEIVSIDWQGRFPAKLLFKIAEDFKDRVFIGIKGGEMALKKMTVETIRGKEWSISTESTNAQWIDGKRFYELLKGKEVF